MASLADNFAKALDARASDLAEAKDTDAVQEIVADAQREAVVQSAVPNTFVYQATVVVLGSSVLAVVAAQLWITLVIGPAAIPDGMIAIGSVAIGALAGLLAPTPSK